MELTIKRDGDQEFVVKKKIKARRLARLSDRSSRSDKYIIVFKVLI